MNIINEKVTDYLNGMYQPLNPELGRLRMEAEARYVPVILRDTEGFLLNLIRMKRPARILEIGTAVGYSSCCFATCALQAGFITDVVTVEADGKMYEEALKNIEKLGLSERIQVICGDGRECLKEYSRDFDMVFIDAAKGQYRRFWETCLPLCKSEAVIICDNVLMKAATVSDEYDPNGKFKTGIRKMREFLDYLKDLNVADSVILPVGDGVAFSVLR